MEKKNKNKSELFVIDDKNLSPIDVFVFSKNKYFDKELLGKLKAKTEYGECERHLQVYSFKEIGLKNWDKFIENESCFDEGFLFVNEEAKDIIMIWLALFFTEIPNWLRGNIIEHEIKKNNLQSEGELYSLLSSYMLNRKLTGMINCIVSANSYHLECFTVTRKILIRIKQIWMRAARKFLLKRLMLKGIFHRNFNQKKYHNYLKMNKVLGEESECLKSNGGFSSSTFFKSIESGKIFFVKGNELPVYHSIENEIDAQQLLKMKYPNENWYLSMSSCDPDKKWIKYPFVTLKTLEEYCADHTLTEHEINKLGEFLCECISKLKAINLIHNDLRPGNILVCENKSRMIERFVLIDFGCATVKNKNPWGRGYWGRYMSENVCGRYRYSKYVVDDAVSARLILDEYGGEKNSEHANRLEELFGKNGVYFDALLD